MYRKWIIRFGALICKFGVGPKKFAQWIRRQRTKCTIGIMLVEGKPEGRCCKTAVPFASAQLFISICPRSLALKVWSIMPWRRLHCIVNWFAMASKKDPKSWRISYIPEAIVISKVFIRTTLAHAFPFPSVVINNVPSLLTYWQSYTSRQIPCQPVLLKNQLFHD